MRIPSVIMTVALSVMHGIVNAGPLRACAQVSALIDGEMSRLLANQPEPQRPGEGRTQLRSCLNSRNICTVISNSQGKQTLLAGDVTSDLPVQYISEQGKTFMVRSIPRVRKDSNEYCLISAKSNGADSGRQWDVYGWVLAPDSSEPLPLPREVLDYEPTSGPSSLRGLAAALWFFAERMSGGESGSR